VNNVPSVAREFDAMIVWMNQDAMIPGKDYFIKHTTNLVTGRVSAIRYGVDVNTLETGPADKLELNHVGRCRVTLNRAIAFDPYRRHRHTGAFLIIERATNLTLGAGMLTHMQGTAYMGSFWEAPATSELLPEKLSPVTAEERSARFGQAA